MCLRGSGWFFISPSDPLLFKNTKKKKKTQQKTCATNFSKNKPAPFFWKYLIKGALFLD